MRSELPERPDQLPVADIDPAERRRAGAKLSFGLLAATALLLAFAPMTGQLGYWRLALQSAILPAALFVLMLLIAVRHERRWNHTTARLARLLRDVRAGSAAMEELDAFPHASAPLAEVIAQARHLCHELRAGRQAVRQIEGEILQRVEARTDTLERKLGALRQAANRDALTGLSNRGAFDRVFPELVEQARGAASNLCVVMIDVDHFKPLNDTLGHAAGDEMLRKLGQLIRGAVRDRDEAFRYGGDEFVLVLADTTAAAGRALADRLSRLVEDLARPYHLPNSPRLSCGVVNFSDAPAADAAGLLRMADEDLYRIKHLRKGARAA